MNCPWMILFFGWWFLDELFFLRFHFCRVLNAELKIQSVLKMRPMPNSKPSLLNAELKIQSHRIFFHSWNLVMRFATAMCSWGSKLPNHSHHILARPTCCNPRVNKFSTQRDMEKHVGLNRLIVKCNVGMIKLHQRRLTQCKLPASFTEILRSNGWKTRLAFVSPKKFIDFRWTL